MDPTITTAVEAWLSDPAIRGEDKQEIRDLQAAGNEQEAKPLSPLSP